MRWKCLCSYDGTPFVGWQSQAGGGSIQDIIEEKLAKILKVPVRIHGSGRTDAGVHARGQVFHFDANWLHGSEALRRAIVSSLQQEIQILSVDRASEDFHARYSATGKRYAYYFYLGYASPFETRYAWSLGSRMPDVDLMNDVARELLGVHDFSTFAGNRRDGSLEDPVRDLRMLRLEVDGCRMRLVTEANGYLYKMVRLLAGSLINVGLKKLTKETLLDLWRRKERISLVETAPAHGLFLEHVYYE